jgi:hypothetical protein
VTWKYTFDDGPERDLPIGSSLYAVAAMAAFAREEISKFPTIKSPGVEAYDGHVLALWDDELLPTYPAKLYGLGYNECGSLMMPVLGKLQ